MKRSYISPSLKVVKLYSDSPLMAGSDGSGNYYLGGGTGGTSDKENGGMGETGENANDDDFTLN